MQPPRRTPRQRRAPRSLPIGARPARRQAPHARHRRQDAGGADVLLALSGPAAISAAAARGRPRGRSRLQWPTPSPKCTPRQSATTSEITATGHYDRPDQTNNELTFPRRVQTCARCSRTHDQRGDELAARARDRNRDPRPRAAPQVDHPERRKLPNRRIGRPRCRRCGDQRREPARTESRRPPPLIRPDIEALEDHCSALEQSGRGTGLGDQMPARVGNARVSEAGCSGLPTPASPRTRAPRSALPRVADWTSCDRPRPRLDRLPHP
jgi:hypothetical protein